MLKSRIEELLQPLLGLSIWDSTRAMDMMMFDLGPERTVTNRRGNDVLIGTYGLHVFAPWRLRTQSALIVGSADRHLLEDALSPLDQDVPQATAFDSRMRHFWQAHHSPKLTIKALHADDLGGLTLALSKNIALDIFPSSSVEEYWRLLPPASDAPHIVISAAGLDMIF